MKTRSHAELLDDLARILAEFQGREYSGPIGAGTRFFADLGLASIDAVVLGEQLQRRYGRPLPFGELMAELGRRADRDLTLGELAAFLERSLAVPGEADRNRVDA
ncbi:MAG TPA: acyl carrier protein [Isosphaeraceae bacterium]|nr:acyl carrier protein [Isosphaeraceae bacterium]